MPIVMQYILNDESYTIEANHFIFYYYHTCILGFLQLISFADF